MTSLKVAIDLGSDKVKVAFAYKDGEKAVYGKLADRDVTGSIVTPAIAYYDEESGRWLFGEDVYRGTDRPFITVVKIKTLISLLMRRENKAVTLSNREFYRNGYDFPKFYFPVKKKSSADLKEAVDLDMTFKGDVTPEKVCESFFVYLAQQIVNPAIMRLGKERNLEFDEVDYALVYPAKAGKEVVDELKRLVRYAFGKLPRTVISATKALGLLAYHRGALAGDEQLVIVDMGEEDISVAKLSLNSDKTVMEEFSHDGSKLLRRTTFLPDKTIISKGIEDTPSGSEKTQETYKFFQNELSEYSQNTQTKNDSKKASRVFLYAFDGFLIEYNKNPEIIDKKTFKAEKKIEYSFDSSLSFYFENITKTQDGSIKASKAINEYNEYFENYEWNEPQKRTKAEKMVIFDEKNKPSRVYFGYDANNKTIEKSYTITQKGAKDTTKEDIEKEFYNFV